MVVPIPVESKDIIKAYLLCLNPLMKLRPMEIKLLDAMLKVYYNLKAASKKGEFNAKDIDDRLIDPVGRKITRDLIGMSEASHNNHIGSLKKKGVLTKEGYLQDFLKKLDSEDLTINYKIKVVKAQPKPVEVKKELV
jgi:DNA-binding transcriptional ArsR family regulator